MNVPSKPELVEVMGSVRLDRRSPATGLSHIGFGLAEWTDSTPSEPWVLPYEEALYVIAGEITILAADQRIVGRPGDVVTVERGTEIISWASPGTRVFYASHPGNWRELEAR